jgi:hypothetical protein
MITTTVIVLAADATNIAYYGSPAAVRPET